MQVKEKALGFDKSKTTFNQINYNTPVPKQVKKIKLFNPSEPIQENPPEEHPEDLSRRKTPCEELDFPKIRTSLYNQIYFFINKEEMEAAA